MNSQVLAFLASLLVLGLSVAGIRTQKNWAHPVSLVSVWIFFFIGLDGLYTVLDGFYGLKDYSRKPVPYDGLTMALLLWVVALISFLVGYFVLDPPNREKKLIRNTRNWESYSQFFNKLAKVETFLLIVSGLITAYAVFSITRRAVAVDIAVGNIGSQRNRVIADGGGVFLLLLLFFKAAVLIVTFRRFADGTFKLREMWFYMLAAAVPDLLVGARTVFVLSYVVPLLVGYHRLVRPVPVGKLVFYSFGLIVFLVPIYRTVTRDVVYQRNRGIAVTDLVLQHLQETPQLLFGGTEIAAVDATMEIMDADKKWFGMQGSTILEAPLAPIPRQIYGDNKPYGGASTIFTQTMYPNFYGQERSELVSSFAGELYMNFSWVGVCLGFLMLGFLLAALRLWSDGGEVGSNGLPTLLYAIIIGRVLALLRGDLFGFSSQVTTILVGVVLFAGLGKLLLLITSDTSEIAVRRAMRSAK